MKSEYTWLWVVLGVVIGALLGSYLFSSTETIEVPKIVTETKEVPVEKIVNVTVEKPVADASLYLKSATDEVFDRLGDEDEFLICDSHEYDLDEVELTRITEWSYTWLDDDEYKVNFTGKFKFDDSSDDSVCRETRTYEVFYEEGERPEVTLL